MTSPNRADLAAYLNMIFGYCDPGEENAAYCIALRGLGEKGTDKEGDFRDIHIVPPIQSSFDIDRIFGHVQRWSQHGRASFIVPAAVAPVALSDPHATEDRIMLLTTIVVDIDKGDTDAKLAHAVRYLGQPSMVVLSGGTTETSHPKIHVYWRLSEPSGDVERIAAARKCLALKVGGDAAFGRSTQVIRLPGSIYNKNNVARPCRIDRASTAEYEIAELLQAIEDMPVCDGVEVNPAKVAPSLPMIAGAGLNFSGFKQAKGDLAGENGGAPQRDITKLLTTPIDEGGTEDTNRWSEWTGAAGHFLFLARDRRIGLIEAHERMMGWVEACMVKKWPPARIESEWRRLVSVDEKNHGPMPDPVPQQPVALIPDGKRDIDYWHGDTRQYGAKYIEEDFIVDGLIIGGQTHSLTAAGAVGKTYMAIEMAIKVALAADEAGGPQDFLGFNIKAGAGGKVVAFLAEDNETDINNRCYHIFNRDNSWAARKNLHLIPMEDAGGVFTLVESDKNMKSVTLSKEWAFWVAEIEKKVQGARLVILDTLSSTLHDDENNMLTIRHWFWALREICRRMKVGVLVTHHVKKRDKKNPIRNEDDMLDAMRGSGNIVNSFRVNIGVWPALDYQKRMRRLNIKPEPKTLYDWNIFKGNPPKLNKQRRSLLRDVERGMLVDVTQRELDARVSLSAQQRAWMVFLIEWAAKNYQPFTRTGKGTSFYGRRNTMPTCLKDYTRAEFEEIVDQLIENDLVVTADPHGKDAESHLDVPHGPLAMAQGQDGGVYKTGGAGGWKPPAWDQKYRFDAARERIIDAPTRPINNPNLPQSNR